MFSYEGDLSRSKFRFDVYAFQDPPLCSSTEGGSTTEEVERKEQDGIVETGSTSTNWMVSQPMKYCTYSKREGKEGRWATEAAVQVSGNTVIIMQYQPGEEEGVLCK